MRLSEVGWVGWGFAVCRWPPKGAPGDDWVGWDLGSFLGKGAGWWNMERGPVQPGGPLGFRGVPVILGPMKTLLSVLWISGRPWAPGVPRTAFLVFRPV